MPHDVFISYSSKDKPAADAICAALEAARIRCWIAPRDVIPGRAFAGEIKRAIEQCSVMVLVFSSHSNDSEDVLREVQLAARKRCHIVNFRIEDVNVNDDLDYYLTVPHWLDALTPPLALHYSQLVESVKVLLTLDRPARGKPETNFPVQPTRTKQSREAESIAEPETDSKPRDETAIPDRPLSPKKSQGPPPVPNKAETVLKKLFPGL